MDRRWLGVAVVAAAALTALITPSIVGARFAGSATIAPIPGPPQVGQCLQADPGDTRSAMDVPNVRVRSGPVGPCADRNFGEVVLVDRSVENSLIRRTRELVPWECRDPANNYLSWWQQKGAADPARPDSHPDSNQPDSTQPDFTQPEEDQPNSTAWAPATTQSLIRFGPDQSQSAAGQSWLACVMLPRTAPYSGSIRGGRAGPAANAFGACRLMDSDSGEPYVPCAEPHDSEVFGFSPIDPAQVPALLQACAQLIVRVTGLSEATAGGALAVWVEAGGSFGDPLQGASTPTAGRCVITTVGARPLDASLIGIGDGPLPWVQ